MTLYVDGYVLAVPTASREAYRELAEQAATVFRDCGALSVCECWGDDVLSHGRAVQTGGNRGVLLDHLALEGRA